jgi:hypothetical protein
MTKSNLAKHCRYYRGGKNPNIDEDMAWFWDMERVYVEHNGEFSGESEYYKTIGGKEYKGIPHALLIIMFTSWAKGVYDKKKEINNFYKLVNEYLSIPNDHFPEDEIPNRI